MKSTDIYKEEVLATESLEFEETKLAVKPTELLDDTEFCTDEAIDESMRFKLLRLRDENIPEFKHLKMVPLTDLDIPNDAFMVNTKCNLNS